MAFFKSPIHRVRNATVFVSPCESARQFTRYCIDIERERRFNDTDEVYMNAIVIPVPRSALRKPTLYDARVYSSIFEDLKQGFDVQV